MRKEYVLREKDDNEIGRLAFQHKVWKCEAALAIQLAEVRPGDIVLDLGSGPGYLAFEIAEIIGPSGKVYCLDSSEKFLAHIRNQHLDNVIPVKADLLNGIRDMDPEPGTIDRVFCRWVLMFLGNAEKLIEDVYKVLRPDGRFVSMEYFRFMDISLTPPSGIFDLLYDKVWELLRQGGGDPDIGSGIAEMMQKAGFSQVSTHPVFRSDKPKSPLWEWLDMTNANHGNLVDAGLITAGQLKEYYEEWDRRSGDDATIFSAPPLMITVGVK